MKQIWTVKEILEWIEGYLQQQGVDNPRLSTQWLVADVLNCSRLDLYTDLDRPLSEREREILREYTKRRATGEPLQYITGTTGFRFLTLFVEPGVLIPRPETEVLVSEAIAQLPHDGQLFIMDVGTGSGNIACALASELPQAHVLATDISSKACALAQKNVNALGLEDRVLVVQGNLGTPLPDDMYGKVNLIISNPPYIPSSVLNELDSEVKDFEPLGALDGGEDGLVTFRHLIAFAYEALAERAWLAVELHETCLERASELASTVGYSNIRIAYDLAGKPRILLAQR